MGDIVNLRRARKARSRSESDADAAANRLRFGRTLAEREGEALERGRASRLLDGARREAPASNGLKPGPQESASHESEARGTGD